MSVHACPSTGGKPAQRVRARGGVRASAPVLDGGVLGAARGVRANAHALELGNVRAARALASPAAARGARRRRRAAPSRRSRAARGRQRRLVRLAPHRLHGVWSGGARLAAAGVEPTSDLSKAERASTAEQRLQGGLGIANGAGHVSSANNDVSAAPAPPGPAPQQTAESPTQRLVFDAARQAQNGEGAAGEPPPTWKAPTSRPWSRKRAAERG